MRTPSPLRYPGGKAAFHRIISAVMRANRGVHGQYAEPYAGGCGLALALLYENAVSQIRVNDIDRGVYCFWHSVLENSEDLVALIKSTPLTVQEWHAQKEVYRQKDESNPLSLGFSTLFLNRTNRSGIIQGAGVIGGLRQEGKYKIGCRFNREALIERIRRVARYRSRIHLSCMDAVEFISTLDEADARVFLFVDPPYFAKGSSLYVSHYKPGDHRTLADALQEVSQRWVLTYDDEPEIRKLYRGYRQFSVGVQYSVNRKRQGKELLIPSKYLRVPSELGLEVRR